MNYKIIAVDFDGTLCENEWPDIGAPNIELINYLKQELAQGNKVILWTCRDGKELDDAVEWCREQGLIFSAVNQNDEMPVALYGSDSRKIFANVYIDDKMCSNFKLPFKKEKEK